jgi:hypothetical protein
MPNPSNPWLEIPLADYEGHMQSSEVQQLSVLADLFESVLRRYTPTSLAIPGIAGGNGLDRIDRGITKRVVGIDINRGYLDEARTRYGGKCDLELYPADLSLDTLDIDPVQLVHAALVFEHAGVERCLENAIALVTPDGLLSVVLQLPSDSEAPVGSSAFPSMHTLRDHFIFVDRSDLCTRLRDRGFEIAYETTRPVPAGKRLWLGVFQRTLS